jgi:hypothetical protein
MLRKCETIDASIIRELLIKDLEDCELKREQGLPDIRDRVLHALKLSWQTYEDIASAISHAGRAI